MSDDILNCERLWNKFYENLVLNQSDDEKARYRRVNPTIGRDPPALDEKKEIERLQVDVQRYFQTMENKLVVDDIALQLIASTFYFERKDSVPTVDVAGDHLFRGRLHTRQPILTEAGKISNRLKDVTTRNRTSLLSELGTFFLRQQRNHFQPYFAIEHTAPGSGTETVQPHRLLGAS
jgi:hypothetical protein